MVLKKSLGDFVIDKLHERRELIRAKLAQQYKRTKPFRMEEVPPEEQLYAFNQLTPEQMAQLNQQLGEDAFTDYVKKMRQLQSRYNGGQENG